MKDANVFVVGMGPGKIDCMTNEAKSAIEKSDLIVGYSKYIELIKQEFSGKAFFSNGMMKEVERCEYALKAASEGKIVSVVCSGDPGVYGMASLVLELAEKYENTSVKIVPGVTAATSGAARLGSPLTADFCVISLSDLLTPERTIEKRLRAAAAGDFPIVLYNPMSNNRPNALKKACSILLETLPADRLCGWVRNIARDEESFKILTLGELRDERLDMFCTVFVGNSITKVVEACGRKWMLNPRGYFSR